MNHLIPIHEIRIPNEEDNQTLSSELTALLTTSNNNHGYINNIAFNSSYRQQTHPTESSGNSQESSITKRSFQLAALLGLFSLCTLLYTDMVVNMTSANDRTMDQWSTEKGSRSIRGDLIEESNDDDGNEQQHETSFWHKIRNVDNKSAKKRKKKTKSIKKPNTLNDVGTNDTDQSNDDQIGEEIDDDGDTSAMNNGNDEITYPKPILNYEPKLIPDDVIAEATQIDESKNTEFYKPMDVPVAQKRCDYVIQTFEDQNIGVSHDFLKDKYLAQSVNPNIFYRATALLFWKDFGGKHWGEDQNKTIDLKDLVLLDEAKYEDGTPLSPMSTWTWITGDQHLSNFGAWRNRGGEVVFSVNDFDEAAIYDFHIDVLRIAVSICNHGFTNGLSVEQVSEALEAFTYKYVKTAIGYVGGDSALLYELTADTSTGVLRDFLVDVGKKKSQDKQLEKFTETGQDGERKFSLNNYTRLENVPKELEDKIRAEITSSKYGASLMKMGWRVRGWDDDFFRVLDIARRVGSGIGSYGVDRFYILLKGQDTSFDENASDSNVILDVKYEPISAVSRTLNDDDKAWYEHIFKNEADRTALAQRALTSFTDPYVGWIEIDGNAYYVRQRSPYKASLEVGVLTDHNSFVEFVEQIAIATATSHVRGSVSKSPGQFKHVIKVLLAGDRNRRRWGNLVAKIAFHYRNQVLLDFSCFKEYVQGNFA